MKSKRMLFVLLSALALFSLATLILILFYRDLLHTRVLIPIIRSAYTVKHYLDHLHGLVLWLIPLGLFSIPLFRGLVRALTQQAPVQTMSLDDWPVVPQAGELEALAQQLQRSRKSRFARARIARNLRELAARMIASREGISVPQARQRLESGVWKSHPEVHDLLMPRRHYAQRQTDAAFDRSLEHALEFLEAYHEGA